MKEMNKSSFFIPMKALFGSYPTQNSVDELEQHGVVLFVNLTEPSEALEPYTLSKSSQMIQFPITDRKIPTNPMGFSKLIRTVADHIKQLKNTQKVYIHCKGGHGRAGIIVACLLCHMYNIEPSEALVLTTRYHSQRKEMRPIWRSIGSPQTTQQKNFVIKMFTPLRFYKAYKSGPTTGFSNFSAHSVYLKQFDKTFASAEAAFNAFKDPDNTQYIDKLCEAKTPFIAKDLSKLCNLRNDWYDRRYEFMTIVINAKVSQHSDLRENLTNSMLRPIIHHTQKDKYWGDGIHGTGQNILGKILMDIRKTL